MTAVDTEPTSYDEVPYASYPYSQSHPDRLATMATLFGMRPAAVEKCRVLELGCCSGGNLIPIAERFPNSQFLGIDLSSRQIAEGLEIVRDLGLRNLELRHLDLMDFGLEFGQFDYIIAHGVFSWVPNPVQDKILAICRANLAPQGVAYISYNTNPGWRMRGTIRDMMCYRAKGFQQPADRVRHARGLIDFLAQTVPTEDNAYGLLLQSELNLLRDKEDHYLLHEHLEDVNEPLYFHQFAERAMSHQLQYLGESDFRVMSVSNFPRQVEAVLHSVASDLIEMEQYMDFVRNRMFRQTLLCHKQIVLDRSLSPAYLQKMQIASASQPENREATPLSNEPVKFVGPTAVMTTSDSLVKAAMLHLGRVYPQSVPFKELLAIARSHLNSQPVVVDTTSSAQDARRLAEPMLRCYATTQIELSTIPSGFVREVTDRPHVSPNVRRQARKSNLVTNARHESIALSDVQRHIVEKLDGQHRLEDLIDHLVALVADGRLLVHTQGQLVCDSHILRSILEDSIKQQLPILARQALLVECSPAITAT